MNKEIKQYKSQNDIEKIKETVELYEARVDERLAIKVNRLKKIGIEDDLTEPTLILFEDIKRHLLSKISQSLYLESNDNEVSLEIYFRIWDDPRRKLTLGLPYSKKWSSFKWKDKKFIDGELLIQLLNESEVIESIKESVMREYEDYFLAVNTSLNYLNMTVQLFEETKNQIMEPSNKEIELLREKEDALALRTKISMLPYYELVDLVQNSILTNEAISENDLEKSHKLTLKN